MENVIKNHEADASGDEHQVVVSSDKLDANSKPAEQLFSNSGSAIDDIIDARKQQENWHDGNYKRSNEELYNILTRCLDAYQRMQGNRRRCLIRTTEQGGGKFAVPCALQFLFSKIIDRI